ncbi:MAG: formylglycine-generating enzyme family protein [bacterium]|nr:formylglycine-generating enzyme family protein [bacterium]
MRDSYTRYPRPILWLVRGGEVTLGGGEEDAQPAFDIAVEPFYISKFPVTNEQLEAFDPGFERSEVSPGDRDPATGVSFETAVAYCRWYAGVARKPMRLPTEVEWEHACRAGAKGKTWFDAEPEDAEQYLWHQGNSGGRVQKLDDKKANELGLYGMLGGVWEWTSSLYRPYPLSEPFGDDGALPGDRVLRGGSFRLDRAEISCSLRRAGDPTTLCDDVGFRIVKSFR